MAARAVAMAGEAAAVAAVRECSTHASWGHVSNGTDVCRADVCCCAEEWPEERRLASALRRGCKRGSGVRFVRAGQSSRVRATGMQVEGVDGV